MPLAKGSSPETISANIAELVRSGHEPAQAAAIAYKAARGEDSAAGICYRAGDSVLLVLRSATAGDYPHTWGFPGGGIEAGETPEQAAIRESQEEIAYTPAEPFVVLDWDNGFTTFGLNVSAPFTPALNEEHVGFVWAPLAALPQPLHPGVAATLARLPVQGFGMDASRVVDGNGWFEVKANPISKAGVFPYSGRQLGLTGPDADRIFQVLRPPEELSDPDCIESFKLIPWIDEHVMLGPAAQEITDRAMAAEKKGVQGVIGEDVFFKDGILFANIKAFSSTLAALIQAGKRELSAGYRCIYDISAGVWNGQKYDAVQRKIRGNHLALVTEGRMGPDVAVMDRLTFTFDAKEIQMATPEENQPAPAPVDLAAVVKQLEQIAPQVQQLMSFMEKLKPLEQAEHGTSLDKDPAPAADKDPAAPAPAPAPAAKEDGGEGTPAGAGMDEATFVRRIAQRDTLAKQISAHVGAFDHAQMTLDGVVQYGCDKLGLKADKGHEAATLAGFLQAKGATVPAATVSGAGMDSAAGKGNFVTKHLKGV